MQLSTRQHRLQHITGIHSAIRLPGTDNGMQLINK